MCYCFPCLLENWHFEVGEMYICGHLYLHLFSQSLSSVLLCGDQLLNVTFNYLSSVGVFGGHALY